MSALHNFILSQWQTAEDVGLTSRSRRMASISSYAEHAGHAECQVCIGSRRGGCILNFCFSPQGGIYVPVTDPS